MGSPATLPVEDAACLFCPTAPWAEIGDDYNPTYLASVRRLVRIIGSEQRR